MMRIVLIHRYFWPDTPPYAHILKEIALELGAAGHHVTVLTCQPSYNRSVVRRAPAQERLTSRVEVRRWSVLPDRRSAALKAVNLVLFCLRLLIESCRLGEVDVVMVASTPPVVPAKVASWLARRRGASFVYHKQDIYPEVAVTSKVLRLPLLAAASRHLDARTERRADRVVVLSNDMAETERSRGVESARIAVINNFDPWSDGEAELVIQRWSPWLDPDQLQVVFAGNLGRFQGLETVVAAVVNLRHEHRVAFHFFGDGALRPLLDRAVASHQLRNVHVHGYRPAEEVAMFLQFRADLGIVSLSPGVIRAAFPSRTLSYLRHGCPVLALVEKDSELARVIVSAGAGLQAEPDDPDGIARTIRCLSREPARLAGAHERARALYDEQFRRDLILASWIDLFTELERDRVPMCPRTAQARHEGVREGRT